MYLNVEETFCGCFVLGGFSVFMALLLHGCQCYYYCCCCQRQCGFKLCG